MLLALGECYIEKTDFKGMQAMNGLRLKATPDTCLFLIKAHI